MYFRFQFFVFFSMISVLNGCAEDTTDVNLTLAYPSDSTLRSFMTSAGHGTPSVRMWYTFDNLVTSSGAGANIIQPSTARPKDVAATATTAATFDWSVATGNGTSFVSGDIVTLTGIPLGQTGLKFAIEILQQFTSDGQLHPVAYAIYNYGPQSTDPDQLKVDLASPITLKAGRSCGSVEKAQTFTGALTDSLFTTPCQ
jgi:hypothetical protein